MAYNLDNLWSRADTEWSTLETKALVAIAIEIRELRRVLQPTPSCKTEALERAAKVADKVYENEHNAMPDDKSDGHVVAEYIAAAIRALKDDDIKIGDSE